MKNVLLILIFLFSFSNGFSQDTTKFNFDAKPDSILEAHEYGFIYITSDTSSKLYKWIVPTPNNESIKNICADFITEIKNKNNQKVKQFSIGKFPRKWNEIHIYKNQYFLYGPSDWMYNSGFYISDSIIYITKSDPDDVYLIKEFNSKGIKNAKFSVVNYSGETLLITLNLTDENLGIYEWIIDDQKNAPRKFLMQNSDYSKKLKMIVCDCGDNKCLMEFKFDQ